MQTANKVWLTPHEVEQMYGVSRDLLWLLWGTGDVQRATIASGVLSVSRALLDAYMARRALDASDGQPR